RAALLEKVGIRTVEDALWFLPWRYEDRSIVTPIGQVSPGMDATVYGTVQATRLKRVLRRNFSILEVTVQDETGRLVAVFFNQPYLEKLLPAGARVMLSGRVSAGRRGWTDLRLDSPQYEVLGGEGEEDEAPLHVGRIVPIYHETKGLTSRLLRVVLKGLLEHYRGALAEVFPDALRRRLQLPMISEAMPAVHFPPGTADRAALERGTTPAHRRLAFEEFFLLELALALRHQGVKEEIKGIRFDPRTPLLARLRARLPFVLTDAQERVITDIHRDMTSPRPMNRLLQGDVGCGKTVVALHALVLACGSGYQAALMVPTEILAEQHFLNLRDLLTDLGLRTVLLTSGGSATRRKEALQMIASGEAQVVIGTHALIQTHVRFAKLGLAVVDEQHRFGVLQRKTLVDKGYRPDMLVMTATPIPRTLAMTVYGDLDVSVIDAMPPGRQPVRTLLFAEGQRPRAYQLLLQEVRAGRQGYLVYPLIEESEKVDLQAAIQGFERLRTRE
ncbi:MAG: ATP-dependent DNA helicase RecG, partial [Nitrospirales bacterium]